MFSKKIKIFTIKLIENIFFYENSIKKKKEINYENEFKKIALVLTKPLGIGDLIMSTPFINSIRKGFPKAKIHLITDKPVFDKLEQVDKVIYVSGNLTKLNLEFRKLKNNKYDLGIVMNRGINQAVYLNKLSPRFKLGYLGGYKILSNFKLVKENLFFNKKEHFRNMSLKIAESLGIKKYPYLIEPKYQQKLKTKLEKYYNSLPLDNKKKIIGVNPYVLWETRRWDENNYIKLIEGLSSKFNFVLTGGPDSIEVNKKIEEDLIKKNIKVINLTSLFSLKESIYFMKFFDLFLTADCGPMHFALMMKTPTLALFGPVNPEYRMPYNFKKNKNYDSLWFLDYEKGNEYDYESEHIESSMVGLKAIPVQNVESKILKFFKEGGFN